MCMNQTGITSEELKTISYLMLGENFSCKTRFSYSQACSLDFCRNRDFAVFEAYIALVSNESVIWNGGFLCFTGEQANIYIS